MFEFIPKTKYYNSMSKKMYLRAIVALLFISLNFTLQAQILKPQPGMSLVGRITDGLKGVSGVVVSDGFKTTVTDSNGVYQLLRNDSAKFVFISVPNNYKLPVDGSVPVFYKAIDQRMEVFYANFQLEKAPVADSFVLVAIADPQPSLDWEVKRFRTETAVDINRLVAEYPQSTDFFGIVLGDLTWDAPELYGSYKDVINEMPFSMLQVIGNHDHDETVIGHDRKASHNYEKNFGPAYYSYNRGQCHFVVLDNVIYHSRKSYKDEITQEQLDWLKEDLKHVSKDKLIVLGAHVPMQVGDNKVVVSNAPELYEILDGYKTVLLSGHRHRNEYTKISENIEAYNISATFGFGWIGDIAQDGTPNGYGVFEIEGADIKNQYFKGVDKAKDYQMRLYPLGSWSEKNDCVLANVWNWNEDWSFEIYENGKLMKNRTLTQYHDYDPYAYEYMFGKDKPKHRPKTEPHKTNHMFYYKPKNKKAVVKIVAKDNFGNIYSEEVNLKNK